MAEMADMQEFMEVIDGDLGALDERIEMMAEAMVGQQSE